MDSYLRVDSHSPWVPLGAFAAYSFVYMSALDYTLQGRFMILPILLLFGGWSLMTMHDLVWPADLGGLWGIMVVVHMAITSNYLYNETWTLPPNDPSKPANTVNIHPLTWRRKFKMWQGPQPLHVLTDNKKNDDQKADMAEPFDIRLNKPQSRTSFILYRLAKIVVYCLIKQYVAPKIFPGMFAPLYLEDFSATRSTIIRRAAFGDSTNPVTQRELLLRAIFPFYWLFNVIYAIDMGNLVLTIIYVAFCGDSPQEWPSAFGSMLDAYNVRRFWGKLWHKMAFNSHISFSRTITHKLLRVKPSSAYCKMLVAGLVFAISGASHAIVSWADGDATNAMGDIWFFMASFAIGITETVIEKSVKSAIVKKGSKSRSSINYATRVAGLLYTYFYLFWMLPKWQYPKLHTAISEHLAKMNY